MRIGGEYTFPRETRAEDMMSTSVGPLPGIEPPTLEAPGELALAVFSARLAAHDARLAVLEARLRAKKPR